jgi:nucleotide-binding universal stress UspA family protein
MSVPTGVPGPGAPHPGTPDAVPPVVVGVDGSEDSRAALVHALAAAARRGAALRVVSTFPLQTFWWGGWPLGIPLSELRHDLETRVRDLVAEVRGGTAAAGVPGAAHVAVTLDIAVGPAAGRLVDASARAGLVVVGTHGRGVARDVLLGSVAMHCVAHAHCPVLVVRTGTGSLRRGPVVVGVDGSTGSRAALAAAVVEAVATGREVVALAVFEMVDHWVDLSAVGAPGRDEVRWQVRRSVEEMVADVLADRRADQDGPVPEVRTVVAEGPPAPVLVREATELDAAVLVVGSHGWGELRGLLVGSVAFGCAVAAPVPVLVVRPVVDRTQRAGRAEVVASAG